MANAPTTRGSLSIFSELALGTVNDRLRQIQEQLDERMGLRGPIKIYDSCQYYDKNNQLLHSWGNSGLTS